MKNVGKFISTDANYKSAVESRSMLLDHMSILYLDQRPPHRGGVGRHCALMIYFSHATFSMQVNATY